MMPTPAPETPEERRQLELWLAGKSVHIGRGRRRECCPDFSCCLPELLASETVRRRYVFHPEKRREWEMKFLARMLRRKGYPLV